MDWNRVRALRAEAAGKGLIYETFAARENRRVHFLDLNQGQLYCP